MKHNAPTTDVTHTDLAHESAVKHVTGRANYTDDIAEPAGTLHAYLGLSDIAHGEISALDLDNVLSAAGVVGVLTSRDIPGCNDISPTGLNDEPVLADTKVEFWGQPVFAVIAETRDQARRAAKKAKITWRPLPHASDIEAAQKAGYANVTAPLKLERGAIETSLDTAAHRLQCRIRIGGQDHMYLEGHIAFAMPGEDEDVTVFS